MWKGKRIAKVPLTKESIDSLKMAISDTAKGRFAPAILKDERRRICQTCPSRRNNRCLECGCFINAKTNLFNSNCPLNKW